MVQTKTNKHQCCVVDHVMWDNLEAKVTRLAVSMNKIKELLLMTKASFGVTSSSKMFATSIMERSQMGPDGTTCLKDIALTLVPRLANIKPTSQALMLQYNGHVSQSSEDDITKIDTLERQIGNLLPKLVESMDLPPSKEIIGEGPSVTIMQIEHQVDILEGD